jgi:hypothetical protein
MGEPETPDPISTGARAAELLEEACRSAAKSTNSLQLEVVRDLALDIGRQLDALADLARGDAVPDALAESALCCADLAILAACNVPELPPVQAPRAVAAARLAAVAVRDLRSLVEAGSGDSDEEHSKNLLRDVRSAAWRAEFAARQVAEAPD